jgi:hypothetical protein
MALALAYLKRDKHDKLRELRRHVYWTILSLSQTD